MKKIIITLCLFFTAASTANAHDDCNRSVEFKCMRPCDVFKGVGCYLKETTYRVGDGLGMIITAPFKAKFCLPKPEKYRYTPGQWHYTPPKFERIKEYKNRHIPLAPPADSVFPLHQNPKVDTYTVKLLEYNF